MDYLLKECVTDKNGTQGSGFSEKVDELIRKIINDKNKEKAGKTVKVVSIVLAVFFGIDFISMILYFTVFGMPH